MEPISGRQRIYSKQLALAELHPHTRSTYIGYLRHLFEYVLEEPIIPGTQDLVSAKYGSIEQPVSRYDYPVHSIDHEREGLVLTGERLHEFYNFVRTDYIAQNQKKLPARRDYAAIVLTGETGLRIDEVYNLDVQGTHRDLFYEENWVQTRFGKGTNGSGKRVRKTIFTPFAQATMHAYEKHVRPNFPNARTNPALFLTETGERMSSKGGSRSVKVIVKAARQAGLELPPKFASHALRRSFATNWLEQYPDQLATLLRMMGHQNAGTIFNYVLHTEEYYNQVINDVAKDMTAKFNATH